jgi:hypothetical protein
MLRTSVDTISVQGRITQGVRVMDLRGDDVVASVAVLREGRLSRVEEQEGEEGEKVGEAEVETGVSVNGSVSNE